MARKKISKDKIEDVAGVTKNPEDPYPVVVYEARKSMYGMKKTRGGSLFLADRRK